MPVHARYYTDPACPASWAAEPALRRLSVDFGADLSFTYVMGGLARQYSDTDRLATVYAWLEHGDRSGMPVDPRLWREGPLGSSFPACMAAKAGFEQGPEKGAALLRSLREGIIAFRRKLDTAEALVEEARRAGLDADRFRIDLGSNAIVELFGADVEETRSVSDEARAAGEVVESQGKKRVPFPTVRFTGEDGAHHWVFAESTLEDYRRAAEAAGARRETTEPPDVPTALRRFGRMSVAEVEAVCGLPTPRAAAELWGMVTRWEGQAVRALTGWFFEPA